MDTLNALSPLDGRYHSQLTDFGKHTSEFALIYQRFHVEIDYLTALANINIITLSQEDLQYLDQLKSTFNLDDAKAVKTIEAETCHDVKAVEYYLKQKMNRSETLKTAKEFVHFGLTSEDINNLAYARMLKDLLTEESGPKINTIIQQLSTMAKTYKHQSMLSRTHGQPASPTTLGKELWVFVKRLERQMHLLSQQEILGKLGGAVGNFNAHVIAFPNIDWPAFAKTFVTSLGLNYNPYTTQIEPHDFMAEIFDTLGRINTILIDLCRDCWGYISLNYFTQKLNRNEVGSSTMPHKVNPIDFENAEGNFGLSSALLSFLAQKLPVSRFQRDLSDSTVLRNMGVAIGYQQLALIALEKGLKKLEINPQKMEADLAQHPEVLTEALQTVMRRYGVAKPYEKLKALSRGKTLDSNTLNTFIDDLALPADEKARLKKLTPADYIGLAASLVDKD